MELEGVLNNAFNEDEDELVKSEGRDIYSKQLDMYKTSDICSSTPPPDKLLIKHSNSAGPEKPPNKKQKTRRRRETIWTTQINWIIWKKFNDFID